MNWLRRILRKGKKKRAGFTLVELMIVVIVVAILAAAAIPIYWWAMARAYSSEAKALLGAIRSVEQIYYAEHGEFDELTAPYGVTAGAADPLFEADQGIDAVHNRWWHAECLLWVDGVAGGPTLSAFGDGTWAADEVPTGIGPWVVADGTRDEEAQATDATSAIDDIIIVMDLGNGEFYVSYNQDATSPTWKVE